MRRKHVSTVAEGIKQGVWIYRRCLYCNNGEADVQYLYHWQFPFLSLEVLLANRTIFNGEGLCAITTESVIRMYLDSNNAFGVYLLYFITPP